MFSGKWAESARQQVRIDIMQQPTEQDATSTP